MYTWLLDFIGIVEEARIEEEGIQNWIWRIGFWSNSLLKKILLAGA